MVRADHPNNVKRGGVCIYYKKSLPVRVINLPYVQEALLLELNDQNKKIIISSLYFTLLIWLYHVIILSLPVKTAKNSKTL